MEEETPPPECPICQEKILKVKHNFTECRRLVHIREEVLRKRVPDLNSLPPELRMEVFSLEQC